MIKNALPLRKGVFCCHCSYKKTPTFLRVSKRVEDAAGYALLPFTVMGLYIYLLAIDYPEMTSDKRWFTESILAILAKALNYAIDSEILNYKHSFMISNLSAKSGFSRLLHPLSQKKQGMNLYIILTLL